MPKFENPFDSILKLSRENGKLTKEEMIRSLRLSIAAEYEAIQIYQQLAEAADNFLFKKIMNNIADEERVHVGEFIRLLFELDGDEKKFYDKGFDEVQDIIRKPSET